MERPNISDIVNREIFMLTLSRRLCVATAIATFMSGASLPAKAADNPPPQITVTGEGEIPAAPDMAIISLGVLKTAITASEALHANNEALAAAITTFKDAGIASADIQTSGFSISPQFDYSPAAQNDNKPPKLTGYQVANDITVRVRDLKNLGKLLDMVVSDGINSGGSIRFTNSNMDELLKSARKAAVKDALDRARELTEAAGVKTGAILSISEEQNSPPRGLVMSMAASKMADRVPVEAGENTYQAHVTVTLALQQ
jgi:uncharacterized protein